MLSSLILSALSLGSMASAAAVVKNEARAGATVWKNPKGGNIQVVFSDAMVRVHSCDPTMVINTLYSNCYDQGFCNANSWTIPCGTKDGVVKIVIEAPEGQYQPWIKNGLVQALNAAIMTPGIAKKSVYNAVIGGGCSTCASTPVTVTSWDMPSSIGISHLNNGAVPDVITLRVTNPASANGLCKVLTSVGQAVAGSVNPVAGGIFTLAALGCT